MTSKLPSHMHPCSQQLNYNPSSYHLHASFMAKFILCGRTHTLSYIPYCASCYFSGFLTDIYTPIHTPARPHNVLHSSSIYNLILYVLAHLLWKHVQYCTYAHNLTHIRELQPQHMQYQGICSEGDGVTLNCDVKLKNIVVGSSASSPWPHAYAAISLSEI